MRGLKIWLTIGKWLGIYNYFVFVDLYSEDDVNTDAILFAKSETIANRFFDSWEEENEHNSK